MGIFHIYYLRNPGSPTELLQVRWGGWRGIPSRDSSNTVCVQRPHRSNAACLLSFSPLDSQWVSWQREMEVTAETYGVSTTCLFRNKPVYVVCMSFSTCLMTHQYNITNIPIFFLNFFFLEFPIVQFQKMAHLDFDYPQLDQLVSHEQ